MELGIIYARARNGVIGRDGVLPWYLPQDLAHFKAVTLGAPVIMGRRTWDSVPLKFRPLPGRRNVVVTHQPDWQVEGAERAPSLESALALYRSEPRVWVIGGGQLYAQALPLAAVAEVTEIDAEFEGDTFAPELGTSWREASRSHHVAADGMRFCFVRYLNQATNGD